MKLLEWGVDGDNVFFFWQASGHQRGNLMNIPATGKHCSFIGSSFFTLKAGKIIRSRRIWDDVASDRVAAGDYDGAVFLRVGPEGIIHIAR